MSKALRGFRKPVRGGPWSTEEDAKLMNHIAKHGLGRWSDIPRLAGIERGGKSCRLRWLNYLRPDLKRAALSQEEEDLIIQLHSIIGNSWSLIAACLPGRTDNGVKNFWNASIKHKLRRRGIDPVTHEPLVDEVSTNVDADHILPSHMAHVHQLLAAATADSNTCSHGALPLPDSITRYVDTDPLQLQHGVVQPVVSSSSTVGSNPSSSGRQLFELPDSSTTTTDSATTNHLPSPTGSCWSCSASTLTDSASYWLVQYKL